MSVNSRAIIAAARDYKLSERAQAVCTAGRFHENPRYFIESYLMDFVCLPANDQGDTIANIHEYASVNIEAKREELKREARGCNDRLEEISRELSRLEDFSAGGDPSYISDGHIRYALTELVKLKAVKG